VQISGKSVLETLGMFRQVFREENMSRTQNVKTHQDGRKARQVKSTDKSMLIIFFDIKGIVHKEFVLASQTVNSTYYCDVLWRLHENVRKLWRQKNWLLHHDNTPSHTSFFSVQFFTKKQHQSYSSVSLTEGETERQPF
jgi:hypothetical protein